MEFGWDEAEQAFREKVNSFIQEHWVESGLQDAPPADGQRRGMERYRQYQQKLADEGWLTHAWPEEYGGRGASHMEQLIYNEASALAGAPNGGMGADRVGPTLILYGTDEQKKEHLPRIANAEVQWCQGYSEPGSGSDLASLQTRAVRDGDDFIINGQKIWTSGAQTADWIHILTRTDPEAPKHRGISYFMVKMDTPGITVRPIQQMHDVGGFTETFYEDVRVPAKNMIGDYNRGWYVSTTTLDFERSGVARTIGTRTQFDRLLKFAQQEDSAGPGRKVTDSDVNRHSLADTAIEMEVGKFLSYRVAWMQSRNLVPNYESSMQKMFGSETAQRNAQRGINMLGLRGALRPQSPHAAIEGRYCMLYMSSVSLTIAAGTSEIQRNIIATRGLGLPRG